MSNKIKQVFLTTVHSIIGALRERGTRFVDVCGDQVFDGYTYLDDCVVGEDHCKETLNVELQVAGKTTGDIITIVESVLGLDHKDGHWTYSRGDVSLCVYDDRVQITAYL